MTTTRDRLFELLPAIHRIRDEEEGAPLRALLQVIGEQVEVLEEDLERLYENWFIETCEDWVVPYLGDLIGYEAVAEAGPPGDPDSESDRRRNRVLMPRRSVANTLRHRRRRGTVALLEQLARDSANWPAIAVEFYKLLAWAQPLNHQRLLRGRTADLRDGDALDLLGTAFDRISHTVDVRRPGSRRTPGYHNIPSVGLHIWRLGSWPITKAPAYCLESVGAHCFTFSILGNDAPLFTAPREVAGEELGSGPPRIRPGPLDVPDPLRRRGVDRNLDDYYGPSGSFVLWADGWAGNTAEDPVPAEALIIADLSGWQYRPPRGRVAVDPVLGRLAFPPRQLPRKGVRVGYQYGFSDAMGGGEYPRTLREPEGAVVYRVGEEEELTRINDALALWRDESPDDAVIELVGGGVYVEQMNIELGEKQTLQIRAEDRSRPVIRLMDWQTARPDALWVRGEAGSRFTLDGLLITGRSVHCEGPLDAVTVRHCTLVPGWSIRSDCTPSRPAEPSLELTDTNAQVLIQDSILGSVQVSQDEVQSDPTEIEVEDSILDATSETRDAVGAPAGSWAHAVLTIRRTTVFGLIRTHAIELGENSIFFGRIHVARRQRGCIRYSYVTPRSRTPRRYRCQPDLVETTVREKLTREEAGLAAEVRLYLSEEPGDNSFTDAVPCLPVAEVANVEVRLEVDHPTPSLGSVVTVTAVIENRGPRDARNIVLELAASETSNLDLEAEPVPSQGELMGIGNEDGEGEDGRVQWRVGRLRAGRRAAVDLRLRVLPDPVPGLEPVVISATLLRTRLAGDGGTFISERIHRERTRVRPRFTSERYGHPGYAQLALSTAEEIVRGSDDESEMGAFHDLFQPQRTAKLTARIRESVPAGMDATLIYVT